MTKKRVVSCQVSYAGSGYHGFARQTGASSVEETLTAAFEKIINRPVKLTVAGRTDSGVHAAGQLVSFSGDLPQMSAGSFTRAVNSVLPEDIRLVSTTFHRRPFDARWQAKSRVYVYNLLSGPENVFFQPYAWILTGPINVKAMKQAAGKLIGRHDFAAFGAAGSDFKTTVRRLIKLEIKVYKIKDWLWLFGGQAKNIKIIQFVIEANAFLYRMCRNLVGFLVEIGRSRLPVAAARQILVSPKGRFSFRPAPAKGLILARINY